jgi:hypothetical protein
LFFGYFPTGSSTLSDIVGTSNIIYLYLYFCAIYNTSHLTFQKPLKTVFNSPLSRTTPFLMQIHCQVQLDRSQIFLRKSLGAPSTTCPML